MQIKIVPSTAARRCYVILSETSNSKQAAMKVTTKSVDWLVRLCSSARRVTGR